MSERLLQWVQSRQVVGTRLECPLPGGSSRWVPGASREGPTSQALLLSRDLALLPLVSEEGKRKRWVVGGQTHRQMTDRQMGRWEN